ncbi:hypothetical protein LCGC14_0565780 [marine sediment metagenome]|uniref:Right handed beta helix domain-containing protein n=1 Tax=marine sediment metagenome TaxID=412755 RepID=A0A0F9U744_9ZZZZ
MALSAGALWGVRPGGNDLNGCYFYDEDPGTSVDYTDQDAAEETFTNLTTSGAGSTTLTDGDAGGLFTAAMPGNGIYISGGTNFTVGMYYVKTRTDANNVVLDRSPTPGGAGASGAGKLGGSRLTLLDAFFEGVSAGDTIWIMAGSFTLTEVINISKSGTSTLRIKMYGYNTTRGDEPQDDARPYIDCTATRYFYFPSHWIIEHFRLEGSTLNVLQLGGAYSRVRNVKSENTSVIPNGYAIQASGQGSVVEDCECISANGYGLSITTDGIARYNECHDSVRGIYATGPQVTLLNNLCYDNTDGIYGDSDYLKIQGNTLDGNSGKGIDLVTGEICDLVNNILSNNGTGVNATNVRESNYLDYNDFFTNGTDVTNVTKGANTLAVDPDYVNRAIKNFSLNPTSALIAAGLQLRKGVG